MEFILSITAFYFPNMLGLATLSQGRYILYPRETTCSSLLLHLAQKKSTKWVIQSISCTVISVFPLKLQTNSKPIHNFAYLPSLAIFNFVWWHMGKSNHITNLMPILAPLLTSYRDGLGIMLWYFLQISSVVEVIQKTRKAAGLSKFIFTAMILTYTMPTTEERYLEMCIVG